MATVTSELSKSAFLLNAEKMQEEGRKASVDPHESRKMLAARQVQINTAQAKQLSERASEASREVIADSVDSTLGTDESLPADAPFLRQSTQNASLTNNAKLLLLMAQLQQTTSEMGVNQLNDRLAIYQQQSEARIKQAQELSRSMDKLNDEFDVAEGEYEIASEKVDTAKEKLDEAKKTLTKAEKALAEAEKKLEGLPDDASKKDIEDAEKAVESAKKDVAAAKKDVTNLEKKFTEASDAAEKKLDVMQKVLDKIDVLVVKMNKQYSEVTEAQMGESKTAVQQSERALTSTGIMTKLMSEFIAKLDENASEKLRSDLAINKQRAEARQAEMLRKAEEYHEQVRKAEAASKMASCIGKIIGGLVTAIGAVTTIFGGGGIALMALGIALMVADPILEATTGQSLTERVMNPIMEHIVMPLMKVVGSAVDKLFEFTGIGALLKAIEKATGSDFMGYVKTAVTAAVAVAAVIVLAMVAKSAVKFLAEKFTKAMSSAIVQSLKTAIMQALNKILPKVTNSATRQAVSAARKSATEAVQKVAQNAAKNMRSFTDKVANAKDSGLQSLFRTNSPAELKRRLDMAVSVGDIANTGLTVAGTGTEVGFSIHIADLRREMAELLAGMKVDHYQLEIDKRILEESVEAYAKTGDQIDELTKSMSDYLSSKKSTGQFIVNKIKA